MTRLKILTFNIESAQNVHKGYWQYVTGAWKNILPHSDKVIYEIADYINKEEIDIATFTEIEGKAIQSRFKSQIEEFAKETGLKYTSFNQTFRVWKIVDQGNGIISKYPLMNREYYKLYSRKHPRYLEYTTVIVGKKKIHVLATHLSLGKKNRVKELQQITDIFKTIKEPKILCGDFNTERAEELAILERANLISVNSEKTYPSWKPTRSIDHIYVSPEFKIIRTYNVPLIVSDHLGVVAELEINEKKENKRKDHKNRK